MVASSQDVHPHAHYHPHSGEHRFYDTFLVSSSHSHFDVKIFMHHSRLEALEVQDPLRGSLFLPGRVRAGWYLVLDR